MNKKRLPLDFLKQFKPKIGSHITIAPSKDSLVLFLDADPDSSFFFKIVSRELVTGTYNVIYKPASAESNSSFETFYSGPQIQGAFENWSKLIEEYNSTETFLDDPIEAKYQEEFINYFELVDEDAGTNPYDIDTVLRLDEHLEAIETKLAGREEEPLKEIRLLAQNLREELTTSTKQEVAKKLSRIWAKIVKQGPKLFKELLVESGKEIFKDFVKRVLTGGIDLLNP